MKSHSHIRKQLLHAILQWLPTLVFVLLSHFSIAKNNSVISPVISDKLVSIPANLTRIEGYLGEKIDLCISERIKKQDVGQLIEPFRHREETRLWQTEFWGKWILSAIASYEYNRDPKMLQIIQEAVSGLLATQTPDGYIGNYSKEAQLQHWDIWGRKYTLLGLLAYYDISQDKKALDAAKKLADFLLSQVGPGKADIVKTGNYRGMPSSSVLEPMVFLYRHTGDQKYLDFAKYIVGQWETADGPKLISKAMDGVPVADRFSFPKTWWSWENGQKAYEMMSCYEGLLELYRLTGEPTYLKSAEMAVKNIIDTEINVAGSGTAFECFYHGGKRQTEPTYHTMETCVTFTWIKLCNNLLRLTGNPVYADQIEKAIYNALMASMKYDGSEIAKYSPLEGLRHSGEEQCNMHINCCNANGPRAFTLIPAMAIQTSGQAIFINLYSEMETSIPLNPKNRVAVKLTTGYPATEQIKISVDPQTPETFEVNLRIPAWSIQSSVLVNGKPVSEIIPGSYLKIKREWQKGDQISFTADLGGRLVTLNGYQAILRGPVLLARDSRFSDGFVDETAIISQHDNRVELIPSKEKPANIWMSFTAPLVLGTDLEGEFRNPVPVHFCDFGSAGNTWDRDTRYRVWIKQTLNVMKTAYKAYQ
jgi:DUF1680 family protein